MRAPIPLRKPQIAVRSADRTERDLDTVHCSPDLVASANFLGWALIVKHMISR
jgi:hypothetical protein